MEAIVTRAKADSATERAVQAIKEWLAKPLVSPEAEAQLRSDDPLAGDVPDLVASPTVRLGPAVGYLRAEERLRTLEASDRHPLQIILDRLPDVPEQLRSLEADFISELLPETHRRAAIDRAFAERLRLALREVQSVIPHASAWASVLLSRPGVMPLTAKRNLNGGWTEYGIELAFIVLTIVVIATK
jgi:hypothetical protein